MIDNIVRAIQSTKGVHGTDIKAMLTGFSGDQLVGTLQNLAALFEEDKGSCYLEVGVFQGLTLLSVATHCTALPCVGIDNFSFTQAGENNYGIVTSHIEKLSLGNVTLLNEDFEDAFEHLGEALGGRRIAVYFIDGPHDYRSQLMCLMYALPYFHENAVIVVDDSNYNHVRQANRDFLATLPGVPCGSNPTGTAYTVVGSPHPPIRGGGAECRPVLPTAPIEPMYGPMDHLGSRAHGFPGQSLWRAPPSFTNRLPLRFALRKTIQLQSGSGPIHEREYLEP